MLAFMRFLALAGLALLAALLVLIIISLWRRVARIRIPRWHLALLIGVISVLTILAAIVAQEEYAFALPVCLPFPYLIIWTIIYKRRHPDPARQSPAQADEVLERAVSAYEEDRLEEALAACGEALAMDPRWPAALNLRGLVLERLGRPHEAMEAFEAAVQHGPAFQEARQNLQRLQRKSDTE
jgi:tetratricopeptide (TPR) repeat protein